MAFPHHNGLNSMGGSLFCEVFFIGIPVGDSGTFQYSLGPSDAFPYSSTSPVPVQKRSLLSLARGSILILFFRAAISSKKLYRL